MRYFDFPNREEQVHRLCYCKFERGVESYESTSEGAIWKKVADLLPAEKQRYGVTVASIDAEKRSVLLSNGSTIRYGSLVSTIPLDISLRWLGKADLADRLTYSSSHIIGIGLRGINPHDTKCWLYYPEDNCPFYRCTVFSLYARGNTPEDGKLLPTLRLARSPDAPTGADAEARPGPYWSLMFEVSESKQFKPVDLLKIVEETIQGAINTAMIQPTDEIVSIYHR
jgi:hypothetical protein